MDKNKKIIISIIILTITLSLYVYPAGYFVIDFITDFTSNINITEDDQQIIIDDGSIGIYDNDLEEDNEFPNAFASNFNGKDINIKSKLSDEQLIVGEDIEPGIYTFEFNTQTGIKIESKDGVYKLNGEFLEGEIAYNIPLNEGDIITFNSEYNVNLIAQSEFHKMNYENIEPGIYIGGKSIDVGTYTFNSNNKGQILLKKPDSRQRIKYVSGDTFYVDEGDIIVPFVFVEDSNTLKEVV